MVCIAFYFPGAQKQLQHEVSLLQLLVSNAKDIHIYICNIDHWKIMLTILLDTL